MPSCFQKLTFLLVFEKCWCPICSMQTRCSEHLCGVLGIFHASIFVSLVNYWQLCPQVEVKKDNWVTLCLFMGGRKTTGLGLENFISTAVACCCQDPSMSHDRCLSLPWKAVFLSFQSCFVCRVQPYWICLVLAHRKQLSMCNQSIALKNFKL